MDFWEMTIDEALSGTPPSKPLAEATLRQFASIDMIDVLTPLPVSDHVADPRPPEEVGFSKHEKEKKIEKDQTVKKKKKKKSGDDLQDYLATKKSNATSLKKAYFDVKKLAISGMEGAEKEEAKVRLAIGLGAKPKKRKYVNYKELKEEKKEDKKKASNEDAALRMRQGGGVKKSKGGGRKSKKMQKKTRRA